LLRGAIQNAEFRMQTEQRTPRSSAGGKARRLTVAPSIRETA
jgi:hypothetical protein